MTVPRIALTFTPSTGGGIPLLLGPSLGTTTAVWDHARDALAERHPLYAWDLPGHGVSPVADEPFTVDELAEGVLAVAAAAGLRRVAAAGVSLGGVVSLAMALAAPERVPAVAMLCSLPRIGEPDAWRERAATVRAQGTPVMVGGSAQRWFGPGFIAAEPPVAGRLLDQLMHIDDEGYARCCEALAVADYRAAIRDLPVPLTLIEGAEDVVIDLALAEQTAWNAPRATLHVLAGVGHLAPAEAPDEVAALLIDAFRGETSW